MSHAKSVLLGYSVVCSQRGAWVIISRNTKQDNQMEWVAQMNNIRSRATEIVNHDIIYN
ncbi:MAG: TnpV protein [Firmicutes bacterium]|nr:TnpV protein [Bacillota bacterium]